MRALLLVVAFAAVAEAQPVACPDDADSCELAVVGKLTYSKRDRLAKWDNLKISTKSGVVGASINIPHRTRLKLEVGTRYRFKFAARKPFDKWNLWVIDAKAY